MSASYPLIIQGNIPHRVRDPSEGPSEDTAPKPRTPACFERRKPPLGAVFLVFGQRRALQARRWPEPYPYSQATLGYTSEGKERTTQRRERCSGISPRGADKHGANLRKHSAVADIRTSARQPDSPSASDGSHRERSDDPRSWWHPQRGC
jgi:hypothetical protein